ncbi:MAG: hypothetical protein EOM54_07505 [Clostridia bacterium]|nr:hypothetical protein [Clostridia bacterium]NCC68142.1 hypothetical protein [Clostridia bacterium]
MQNSVEYMIGFVLGALVGLALIFAIGLIFKKKRGPCKYDERQMLARGKAYSAAFWTLVAYSILNGMYYGATGGMWADMMTTPFLGVFLAILVYAMICIINDAYMPLKEKPGFYFVLFGVILAADLLIAVWNYLDGTEFVTDGMLNYHCLNPAIVIIFAAIIVTLAVKVISAKKDVDEE